MNITIKDIARKAGVSIGTVDRVIHDRKGVSQETREKVQRLIKQFGYEPSRVAQALVSKGKKMRIGVIYPDAERYFWDEVGKGIDDKKEELAAFGIEIVTVKTLNYHFLDQISAIKKLVSMGINGIVMMPYHPYKLNEIISELKAENIYFATFISDAPQSERIYFTGPDNEKSGETAAALMNLFLKEKGNVAIVGIHREVKCIDDRIYGFQKKIKELSKEIMIKTVVNISEDGRNNEEHYKYLVEKNVNDILLKDLEIDGLYITNSLTSVAGRIIEKKGLTGKIKIIGHENTIDNITMLKKKIVHGVIHQNQKLQVQNALSAIASMLISNKIEKEIEQTSIQILIKENVLD